MTTPTIPPALLRDLRDRIISVIAGQKAYNVPALCSRVGLADGDGQEAFASKARYVQVRLQSLPAADVIRVGQALAQEDEDFWLAEALRKIDELTRAKVTTLTRRRLMAIFERREFVSEIPDLDLIRRIWPIGATPAPQGAEEHSLEDYLIRHTVRNDDMSNREVLELLGFLTCSRGVLFRFLEAVVDPEMVTLEEQAQTLQAINSHLAGDGFSLMRSGVISGSPVYGITEIGVGSPADGAISETLAAFNPEHVHARWTAALERRGSDPEGAITLARTLLEDVCKWLLNETGGTWAEADDLPVLYRKLAKELNLAPDSHTEQTFKQILGSCQSIVEGLGSLRNKLGDAHSVGPKRLRPSARHAELAVNLAGTMSTFLVSTWQARQKSAST